MKRPSQLTSQKSTGRSRGAGSPRFWMAAVPWGSAKTASSRSVARFLAWGLAGSTASGFQAQTSPSLATEKRSLLRGS